MSTNSKPLSKDQLLGLPSQKITTYNVTDWGVVRLRYLSGLDRAELERMSSGKLDPVKFRSKLLAMSIANEDGAPMFDENEAKLLLEKQGMSVEDLCEHILKLNKIGGAEVEAEKND